MQEKIEQNKTFLQLLESVKVNRQINDVEAAQLLGTPPSYISNIRAGKRNAGAKLMRKIKFILGHPSYQLAEKSNVYAAPPPIALGEEITRQVSDWAEECGITSQEFVTRCLLRSGQTVRDELVAKQLPEKNRLTAAVPDPQRPPTPEDS